MTGTFMFVDGLQNDRSTKRLMRRHVMQGKNAGKTIHRPSRLAQGKVVKAVRGQGPSDSASPSSMSSAALQLVSSRLLTTMRPASVVASIQTPVAMTPVDWVIIDEYFNGAVERVYAPGFSFTSGAAKLFWFQAVFADAAAFHCSMALMQATNACVLREGPSCVCANIVVAHAHYIAESLSQLKRLLAGPHALANSTILLVLLFISQEQMRRESRNARVHIAGLEKMVALRGGLAQFETHASDRPLLLKICKIDIMYALQFGLPPRFHRDVLQRVLDEIDDNDNDNYGRAEACRRRAEAIGRAHHGPLARRQPRLYETFCDVLAVALIFENKLSSRPVDIFTFGDIFVSLCYRLMKMQADAAREGQKEDSYLLGMLMFSMALFLRLDQGRLMDYEPVKQRFQEYILGDSFAEAEELSESPQRQPELDIIPGERSEEPELDITPGERSEEPELDTMPSERSEEPKQMPAEDSSEDGTCFWIMMMGGTWFLGSTKTWTTVHSVGQDGLTWHRIVRRVRQVADRLGLATWEDAHAFLDRYPWLTVLHDQTGRQLWEASRGVIV